MSYEHDDQAHREAADHLLSSEELIQLKERVGAMTIALGPTGVRGHTVEFSIPAWAGLIECLPEHAAASGKISRGDVLRVGAEVREGRARGTDLLTASFVWGTGKTGYGPTRLRAITETAGARLEPALSRALERAAEHPIAGYAALYGGYDWRARAAAFQEPWTRVHRFGPAFFTKFLYFSTPGALILDNVLARAVHRLAGIDYLVTPAGQSLAWSPYRYAVYLSWMHQTAEQIGVAADLLELTLFEPPTGSTSAEGAAAD